MDVDALLAAISEASPCGEDLSFSAEFDAIQELRRADDPTLDQGEWVAALKAADWPGVRQRCLDLLEYRTKDLRVAAWLTDSAARLDGYGGLADGLSLCARLCAEYGDRLHPQIEDGDLDQRAGNLRWLLTQVEALATRAPVLRDGTRTHSLQDIAAAQAASRVSGEEEPREPRDPRVAADQINAAKRATPPAFLADNLAHARRARDALALLQQIVDARMGDDGPAFAGARGALEDATHALERLAKEAHADGTSAVPVTAPAPVYSGAGSAPASVRGDLRSRADAVAQLRAVAEFFRRTEPHSPVGYLADRAAAWAEMPLHAWLRTVLKDGGTLAQIEELLGVGPPPAAPQ